jgi:hypothetical protein
MTKEIKVAVEGLGADRALAELLAIEGVEGHAAPAESDERTRDGGVLVAVGAIVAIASGLVEITDKILAWRDRLKTQAQARRLSVVIEDAKGNRLALDDATPAQITAVLETLAR